MKSIVSRAVRHPRQRPTGCATRHPDANDGVLSNMFSAKFAETFSGISPEMGQDAARGHAADYKGIFGPEWAETH